MVHSFKFGGQRIAYDSVSGAVIPLSELAYKMLDYIELPMPKDCPSALRYDLAKFDSAAISATYDELYAFYIAGKLFADAADDTHGEYDGAVIALGERLVTHEAPVLLETAKAMAEDGLDTTVRIVKAPDRASALTGDDVALLTKELEKLSREQVKRARGEGGAPISAFCDYNAVSHTDAGCVGCWAKKLCSLESPHGLMCELERKRCECVMMVKAAKTE